MTEASAFAGAVLTGGASRRMGRDKALVPWRGSPLVASAVGALVGAGASSVCCVGGDRASLEAAGLIAVADRHQGQGPLGGLLTALQWARDSARCPVVVVLTCDLPDIIDEDVTMMLHALLGRAEADVAAPLLDSRPQFLSAAYRVTRALAILQAAFAEGERAVRRACAALTVETIRPQVPDRLRDADTPEQLSSRRGLTSRR